MQSLEPKRRGFSPDQLVRSWRTHDFDQRRFLENWGFFLIKCLNPNLNLLLGMEKSSNMDWLFTQRFFEKGFSATSKISKQLSRWIYQ